MRPDLSTATSAELHARLAEAAVLDEQDAALIAEAFRELRMVLGDVDPSLLPSTGNHGRPYTGNHALEYAAAGSTDEVAARLGTYAPVVTRCSD